MTSAQAQSAATVQDRKIIGGAAPYVPDLGARRRATTSCGPRSRRAARRRGRSSGRCSRRRRSPSRSSPRASAASRRFRRGTRGSRATTSIGVFKKLYRDLGPAGRAARAPLDAATIAAAFDWNTHALDEMPEWPEQRYLDYVAAIDTPGRGAGRSAASSRVGYSPGAMRHLLASYDAPVRVSHRCAAGSVRAAADARRARTVTAVEQRRARRRASGACSGRSPRATAKVKVTSSGDGDADLYVRRECRARAARRSTASRAGDASDETCSVDGDGPIYVAVFGAKAERRSRSTSSTSPRTSPIRRASTARCRATRCSSRRTGAASSPARTCRSSTRRGRACASGSALEARTGPTAMASSNPAPGDLHADPAERQRVPHARAPHHDEGARSLDVDHAVVVAAARHRLRRRSSCRDRSAARAVEATTRCASRPRTSRAMRIRAAVRPARSATRSRR